jgi:hypothetical protein
MAKTHTNKAAATLNHDEATRKNIPTANTSPCCKRRNRTLFASPAN